MRICPNCEFETEEMLCPRDSYPTLEKSMFGGGKDELEGKMLADKFRILRLLGRGAFGSVYQAHQVDMDRMVALKVMNRTLSTDLSAVKRFYREVRAASKLEHPNTIRIFDFGNTDDGLLYFTMEFLTGGPMADLIRKEGRLQQARAVHLSTQVLKALSEAHAKGIIHRDLKPDNIFVSHVHGEGEFIKVLDFGLVKFVHGNQAGQSRLTATGHTVGTPVYMSPELARGTDTDLRSDLYSLGVIMYEMLVGKPPFHADSLVDLLVAHVKDKPPEMPPDVAVSPDLQNLVWQLLEKDPNRRPSSAQEVIGMLQCIQQGAPLPPPGQSVVRTMPTGPPSAMGPAGAFAETMQSDPAIASQVQHQSQPQFYSQMGGVAGAPVAGSTSYPGMPSHGALSGVVKTGTSKGTLIAIAAISALLVVVLGSVGLFYSGILGGGRDGEGGREEGTAVVRPTNPEPSEPSGDPATVAEPEVDASAAAPPEAVGSQADASPAAAVDVVVVPVIDVQIPTVAPIAMAKDVSPTKPQLEYVEIPSEPKGARVLIDGEAKGFTPLVLKWPDSRKVLKVRIERHGYEPKEFVLERQTAQAKLPLIRLVALAKTEIRCSVPGAAVFVDGKRLGKAPQVFVWSPGMESAEVKAEKKGYQTAKITIHRNTHHGKPVRLKLVKRRRHCEGGLCL